MPLVVFATSAAAGLVMPLVAFATTGSGFTARLLSIVTPFRKNTIWLGSYRLVADGLYSMMKVMFDVCLLLL